MFYRKSNIYIMDPLNTLFGGLANIIKEVDNDTKKAVAIILSVSGGTAIILKYALPYYNDYNRTKIELARIKQGQ